MNDKTIPEEDKEAENKLENLSNKNKDIKKQG